MLDARKIVNGYQGIRETGDLIEDLEPLTPLRVKKRISGLENWRR